MITVIIMRKDEGNEGEISKIIKKSRKGDEKAKKDENKNKNSK